MIKFKIIRYSAVELGIITRYCGMRGCQAS